MSSGWQRRPAPSQPVVCASAPPRRNARCAREIARGHEGLVRYLAQRQGRTAQSAVLWVTGPHYDIFGWRNPSYAIPDAAAAIKSRRWPPRRSRPARQPRQPRGQVRGRRSDGAVGAALVGVLIHQRLQHQRSDQLPVVRALAAWGVRHEDHHQLLAWIDPELGPVGAAPAELAGRAQVR